MGMSYDEFKTAFTKDLAERKKQQDREYYDYFSIVVYKLKKSKSTKRYDKDFNIMYRNANF